jgi:selenocysteine lyase/cysteine desulfurase
VSGTAPDDERVRGLRATLTATGAGIYLATHVAGPLPAETVAAAHESDELELRIGRVGPDRADDLELREREARAAAAAAINAPFDRVVLAHGAADAARGAALELLAMRGGEPCRVILLDGVAEPVERAISQAARAARSTLEHSADVPRILPADVALVVLPRIDALGRLIEARPVMEAAQRAGAWVLVDGSLSVGALSESVSELGADVLVADVDRWLLGPSGMGLAWLSPDLGEEMPERLRAATAPFARAQLLSLARSVGWLLMYVGLPWATERTASLAGQLHARLQAVQGVDILGGSGEAPMVAFRIGAWDATEAADELSRSIFTILEADAASDVLRVSVGAWNREDELERFVERVAELAAHTPETLPRRPALSVIHAPAAWKDESEGR